MATYRDYNPSKHNDFMTPPEVYEDVKEFIPKDKVIWEPFYGDGTSGKKLRSMGLKEVIHEPNQDFFEHNKGEVVVSNPPYETKKEIIEKLVGLDKPFMLLLPVSTMCYKYSQIMKGNMQLIIPDGRIKYIYLDKKTMKIDENWRKKNAAFDSVWICYKMGFEHDINYLQKKPKPKKVKKPKKAKPLEGLRGCKIF